MTTFQTYAAQPLVEPESAGDPRLPLPAEPHVAAWESYVDESRQVPAWKVLQERLVQLRFPIEAGISQTEPYRRATLKGEPAAPGRLRLVAPDGLQIAIHPTLAGPLPVIFPAVRADFVTLVQALTQRNEPQAIPDSMGACLVSGYNNWDRLHTLRRAWEKENPFSGPSGWPQALREILPQKQLYQDLFVIVSPGPYSGVAAADLGLAAPDWEELSRALRLEHEAAHYFTRRLFGLSRQHLHDELLADYAALVAATGRFRLDWFLRFMGLEDYPRFRPGGRLENYLAPDQRHAAFVRQAGGCLLAAAAAVKRFDSDLSETERSSGQQAAILCAISATSLVELAAPGGEKILHRRAALWRAALADSFDEHSRTAQPLRAAIEMRK